MEPNITKEQLATILTVVRLVREGKTELTPQEAFSAYRIELENVDAFPPTMPDGTRAL